MMTCAPHGNVARHSKDTSTRTLLYLETSGFRGEISGWGFGVGFRGGVSGFRGGVVMPCAPHGTKYLRAEAQARLCFKIRECEKHNEMTTQCRCDAKKHK